ncbi:MAG: ABC transporter permease [Pirellulales bacterium]|nr:ABC transporter permease [Pirellulales bacterium]
MSIDLETTPLPAEADPTAPVAHENAPPASQHVTIIEARPGWKFVDFAELWRYRELLYFLVWRDVKVRYKQTVLGALWAILQPVATMLVFSLFFGRMAEMPSDLVPYPLFVLAGLVPWTFFSNALSQAGGSVVGSQNLVTKVYFPRLFIPLGAIGAGLVDFAIAFVVLIVLMLGYGVLPSAGMLLMPLLTLDLIAAALGVGVLLSALTVAYRDFRHVVPFMVQLWMFATPCIYMSTQTFGPRWNAILPLNPAFGIISNMRAAVLSKPLDLYSLSISTAVALAFLVIGCMYFRRVERSFADII